MDDSDASVIVIEVLCNYLPTFAVCLRSYYVDLGCQVDTVSVTGIKTVVMLWTEFPEFRHKYGQL